MDYSPEQLTSLFTRRQSYANDFNKVVSGLLNEGIITEVIQEGESAFSCRVDRRWNMNSLCREFASIIPRGIFSEIGYKEGIKWSMGNMTGGVLLTQESIAEVKLSQAIVAGIIPAKQAPPPAWTKGGNARILLRYVLDKTIKGGVDSEELLALSDAEDTDPGDKRYQCHDCIPGHYNHAIMWDLEAFFFNLICRLPCLKVGIYTDNRDAGKPCIDFGQWSDKEGRRWEEVKAEIAQTKILRNAVWGVLLGSNAPKLTYSSAPKEGFPAGFVRQRFQNFSGGGLARSAGLLVARSAAEICAKGAAETNSIYSTMDAVTAQDGELPRYWDSLGLPYRVKEKGDMQKDGIGVNIVARGVWQIGRGHTLFYYPDGPKVPYGWKPPFAPTPVKREVYTDEYHTLWV